HASGFPVGAEAVIDFRRRRSISNPQVAPTRGTQSIAQPANHVAHGAPSFRIARGEPGDLGIASGIVVPKLHAGAVEKRDEKAVYRRGPLEAARAQSKLVNHQRMQQPGKIGAGRHAHAGEWLLNRAGSAYALAAFQNQHALAGPREISSAGKAVVPRAYNNGVPG